MWVDDLPPKSRRQDNENGIASSLGNGFAALFFVVLIFAVAGILIYAAGVG